MTRGPLEGLTIIDASSIVAAPTAATVMADYGARVIKIEHPEKGDSLRNMGLEKDGVPLWWKFLSRNKQAITLNLSKTEGQEIFKKIVAKADVLIENFRPGTMEKWGLGYDELSAINKKLVMLRVTGFGQDGPYSKRPGFGTIAEAMSGFAYITGFPDKPPTLPPFALGDSIAGLFGAVAVMFAIWWRDVGGGQGEGQEIDLSLYEPLFYILGPQALEFDQLNVVQNRSGNRPPNSRAPRNTFVTADDRWVAISANSSNIIRRIIKLLDLEEDDRFSSVEEALNHGDELDELLGKWIKKHTYQEVMQVFGSYQAAIGPVYSIKDIFEDPHFLSREDIIEVEDTELGKVKMQGLVPRFSKTTGFVKFAGPEKGAYNDEIFHKWLGLSQEEINDLKMKGVI